MGWRCGEDVPINRCSYFRGTLRGSKKKPKYWGGGTGGEGTKTNFQSKPPGFLALVVGGRGEGMRRLNREHRDSLISIPMAGSVSSLNVSVATGVCLFEIVRQRLAA